MNLFVSAVALALGGFITVSPIRAARIWGWEHLDNLAPKHRTLYFWGFRIMGIAIGLAGILIAVDSIWFH
jgi:hypothetical protein